MVDYFDRKGCVSVGSQIPFWKGCGSAMDSSSSVTTHVTTCDVQRDIAWMCLEKMLQSFLFGAVTCRIL